MHFQQPKAKSNNCPVGTLCHFNRAALGTGNPVGILNPKNGGEKGLQFASGFQAKLPESTRTSVAALLPLPPNMVRVGAPVLHQKQF